MTEDYKRLEDDAKALNNRMRGLMGPPDFASIVVYLSIATLIALVMFPFR